MVCSKRKSRLHYIYMYIHPYFPKCLDSKISRLPEIQAVPNELPYLPYPDTRDQVYVYTYMHMYSCLPDALIKHDTLIKHVHVGEQYM